MRCRRPEIGPAAPCLRWAARPRAGVFDVDCFESLPPRRERRHAQGMRAPAPARMRRPGASGFESREPRSPLLGTPRAPTHERKAGLLQGRACRPRHPRAHVAQSARTSPLMLARPPSVQLALPAASPPGPPACALTGPRALGSPWCPRGVATTRGRRGPAAMRISRWLSARSAARRSSQCTPAKWTCRWRSRRRGCAASPSSARTAHRRRRREGRRSAARQQQPARVPAASATRQQQAARLRRIARRPPPR